MYEERFDEGAATWDENPGHVDRADAVARAIAPVITAAAYPHPLRLVEYGAGTGLVTQALQRELGDDIAETILIDTSSGMREVIEAKIKAGTIRNGSVLGTDLSTEDPPEPLRGAVDVIVTVMTLHHIANLDPVLRRFASLLRPEGLLAIVDLVAEDGSFHGEGFTGHHGFVDTELAAQLNQAGFTPPTIGPCYEVERDTGRYPLFLATTRLPATAR